ncbi:hypothetical protein ACFL35_17790 [Candidatus Riflebacteria bacterium]
MDFNKLIKEQEKRLEVLHESTRKEVHYKINRNAGRLSRRKRRKKRSGFSI